jgi:hypothetical protein
MLKRLNVIAVAAAVAGGVLTLPPVPAYAGTPTAMQRCRAGSAPDSVQVVREAGSATQVDYPRGANPDNAIYPGDVVQVTVTGRVRYDARHWTGPAGVGTRAGIRPYASIANFNNNPDGWVGATMPTRSLRVCTRAPAGYPVRMIYRLNDRHLADNAGSFRITTRVWRAPGRITIDGFERTQGVQNARNQVALIGGKRTFLRVYLHNRPDGHGPMSGVSARLTIDGVAGTIAPYVRGITTSPTGSDHRTLDDSFLFQLPARATAEGTRRATITVIPPHGRAGGIPVVRHVSLTFGPSTSLTVIGIRTSYYNVPAAMKAQLSASQPGLNVLDGWWQARPVSAWEPLRRRAEDALPLAHLTVNDASADNPWGFMAFDCKAVQDGAGNWGCSGYQDAKDWETHYVDTYLCPHGGCTAMLLQPEIDDGEDGTDWGSPAGNSINNMQGERSPDSQGNTFAHELGHSLGLAHTFQDPSYPRADGGLGPIVALRYTPTIELMPGTDANGATSTYDLMSYTRPAWFSVYNYCKAMSNLRGAHPNCAAGYSG